jgi:hypothetical protein
MKILCSSTAHPELYVKSLGWGLDNYINWGSSNMRMYEKALAGKLNYIYSVTRYSARLWNRSSGMYCQSCYESFDNSGKGEQIWSLTWYTSFFDRVKWGGNIWTEGVEALIVLHVDHYLKDSKQWRILSWWVATECFNPSHIVYYFKAREYWRTEID